MVDAPVPSPWYWWIGAASFSSGIALIVIGIILLIVARGMKPEQKTDAGRGLSEMNAWTIRFRGRGFDFILFPVGKFPTGLRRDGKVLYAEPLPKGRL